MTPFIIAGIILLAIVVVLAAVRSLIVICPPNRVAIISGRQRVLSDGREVGYRLLKGGRTIRIPLLERVDWMDLSTISIDVGVGGAYSKGTIPLDVQGVANIKISSKEGVLENSVERFLGRPIDQIAQIAKETLEANLRGVLSTLTPEQVNEDRLRFAQTLIEEADDDIRTLGLDLDVLKIQNVTDEVGYLEAVGRQRTAEVIRSARVAEAERMAEAEVAESESRERSEIARALADQAIVVEQNNLRVRTAELEAGAIAKEEQAKVAGVMAKAVAEQELETARIELQKRRLEADIITPARANKEAMELEAKGDAASIIEDGTAQIEIFNRLVQQYQAAGADAEKIFVLNMLPDLVDKIVNTVRGVNIDRVSVIDSGGGSEQGIPQLLSQLPGSVIKITEQIENATGVNILSGLGERGEAAPPAPPQSKQSAEDEATSE